LTDYKIHQPQENETAAGPVTRRTQVERIGNCGTTCAGGKGRSALVQEKEMPINFDEGRASKAIVHHLEEREKGARADLRWPEKEGHPHPVEAVFTIGDQLYALEHTGIEPFDGHVVSLVEQGVECLEDKRLVL
jgi:hypothetical protein